MSDRTGWLVFSMIVCSLVSFITGMIGFSFVNSEANQFADINDNWKSKAIIDIKVSPNNCPYGYETASDYVWPGSRSGCWCGDISYYWRSEYHVWDNLYLGYCDYNQTMAGCKNILPASSKPISIWSTVNGTKINLCVQRSSESWSEVAHKFKNNTCPQGTIKCGLSPGNTFCSKETQCPINDIQMSLIDPKNLPECTNETNCLIFAQYNSSTVQVIRYKRGDTFDALPTTQFKLSEYGMCRDSRFDDATPGRFDFQLLLKSKSHCNHEGDVLWNNTGYHASERQLFDWNGLTDTIQILSKYGYYTRGHTGDDYQYNLYSRSYIPWKIECRDQMSLFAEKSDTISRLRTVYLALMVICCILGVFLGIVIPITFLSNLSWDKQAIKSSNSPKTYGKYSHYFLRTALIPFQIFVLIISGKEIHFLNSIAQKNCTTSQMSTVLSYLQKDISVAHYGNLISLAIFIFTTFIAIYLSIKYKMARPNQYQDASMLSKYEPESQPNQNNYYSYLPDANDYEKQDESTTKMQRKIPYAPPVPSEETPFTSRPLFEPFNVKS